MAGALSLFTVVAPARSAFASNRKVGDATALRGSPSRFRACVVVPSRMPQRGPFPYASQLWILVALLLELQRSDE